MPEVDPGPFFGATAEPSLMLDERACVLRANAAFARLRGGDAASLRGVPVAELVEPGDAPALLAALRAPTGEPVAAALRRRDGRPREALWSPSPAPGGGWFVSTRDVSVERRHRDAVERLTGTGSWEMDAGGARCAFSPMTRELFGCDPATLSRERRLAFYVGESRARVCAALDALEDRGEPFDLEAAFRDARGRDRWVHITGAAEIRDDRVERVHGTMRDVTAERERRRRLERLGAMARSTSDSVVITGPDLRIEWVNEAFTRQLGHPEESVLGRDIGMLHSSSTDPAALREVGQAVAEGHGARVEVANRHRDGHDVWLEMDLQPLVGEDGAGAGWIAIRADVTQRREAAARLLRAEREARESHGRLKAAVDALEDGFLVFDADLRLVTCNERIREMYPRQAPAIAPGARFEDVLRYGLAHGQWPEAQGREEAWIAERVARLRRAAGPFEHRLPDGRTIRVVERPTPDGGRVTLHMDVTEEREAADRLARAEQEARESRQQLLTAIEALDDGFTFYDRDERLVLCNSRYLEIYRESAPAIVPGASYESIMRYGLERGQYPQAVGREEEWLAERLAEQRSEQRSVEVALPGERWLRIKGRATPDGGRVGLRVDITELKRQQRALEEARARAEAASDAKSRFLATMSHEIRTPMNGILGLVDLLAEGVAEPGQRRLVADVQEAGETLLAILNDVLDFSKIEAGRMTLEAIAFDPAGLARRVERLHGPSARERGLDLRIEAGEGPHRRGDPTRLMQVLGNLASNAIKFTEAGSVVVRARNPADGPLVLEVEDTGIGMSESEAAWAFERFAQADGSVTRRFGGTGLGLSIVRGLVEGMGGRVALDSASGRGTRVTATLPLEPCAPAGAPGLGPGPGAGLAGLSVLAADDNAANRRVLSRLLDRLGAASVIAGSGAEAVASARSGRFDLLLLDIAMPGMDGVEALGRIREGERAAGRAPAPALAVTANVMEDQVAGYLAAGFDGHLAKPLRLAALAEACRGAVAPAPAPAGGVAAAKARPAG